ncbi:MAG: ATPase [Magnetococcales bacterium]|nr:ATPase [Magnetococcales bacterium]HIJ82760.1 ParA family protein [Magnetococcales bacterium]
MAQTSKVIVDRQNDIADGNASLLPIPKFKTYTICNLRGGIGKTSLAFNLSFGTDDLLVVDTCPQGNLSYFYDNNYYTNNTTTVVDMLLPYFIPGLGHTTRVAKKISPTNQHFTNKNVYYVPSSSGLYMLPSQMANALAQAKTLIGQTQTTAIDSMLLSLEKEITKEKEIVNVERCLIDTSPFFSGATHLACHASDALIVPVRTDQQSINSLNLLINTLSSSTSEFRKNLPSNGHTPKIQMVVLTHCGWSTKVGARNKPNQQTKVYVECVRDIVARSITNFTTTDPDNHILLLDDFLGSGRMSSALSKPISLMNPGDSKFINRTKVTVNESVTKIKSQLKYISDCIW